MPDVLALGLLTVPGALMALPVVTNRDRALLTLVGECGYVTTAQAARELFPSMDRLLRRVKRLADAKLLAVTVTSSNEPRLLSLTRRGLGLLIHELPEINGRLRLPGPVRLVGVPHRVAVTDAHLYARALGRRRGAPLLRWSGPGGTLGRDLGLDGLGLRPDGLAEFDTPGGRVVIAVEVDRGTEALAIVERKLSRYLPTAKDGRLDALWLVVATGAGRLTTLAALAERLSLGEWVRLLAGDHVRARPVRELSARSQHSHGPVDPNTAVTVSHG
jgi:hypothetical protein